MISHVTWERIALKKSQWDTRLKLIGNYEYYEENCSTWEWCETNQSKAGRGEKPDLNQKLLIVESLKRESKATQGENSSFAVKATENEKCISLVFLFKKKK